MKKKFIALFLILSLALVPAASFAGPPGPPPRPGGGPGGRYRPGPPPGPPPGHYHHHHHYDSGWSDVAIGAGVGLLLGAILSNSSNAAEQEQARKQAEYDKKVAEVRDSAKQNADNGIRNVLLLTSASGVDGAIKELENSWFQQGRQTFLDSRNNVSNLRVTGFPQNIRIEYIFQREFQEITVRVFAPDYQVSEESHSRYTVPPPVMPTRKYLGFDIFDKSRDPNGGMIINDVTPGTASAFAGMAHNDLLLKVDAYDVKNFDCGRINAYIEGRAEQHAAVKLTFQHQGQVKTASVQL